MGCCRELFSLLLFRFRGLTTSSALSVYSPDRLGPNGARLIDVGTAATMRNPRAHPSPSLSVALLLLLIPEGKTRSCRFPDNPRSRPAGNFGHRSSRH